MKVRFNGVMEKRKRGCNCKGKVSEVGFTRSKLYIMPSGASKTFYVGKDEEVSDRDGEFLLSYLYKDANGSYRAVFSKVE